jgi:hypothetical protein
MLKRLALSVVLIFGLVALVADIRKYARGAANASDSNC